MKTRFVPDAQAAWLVYDLGTLVLALPAQFRAAADAIAATPGTRLAGALAALDKSGVAEGGPFAVLEWMADGVHIALRGPSTVSAGAETLTGLGAEKWLERTLPDVGIVRLTVPGGEWMFTVRASAALAPRVTPPFETTEITEITEITAFPDVEMSLPSAGPAPLGLPPLGPPPLGLPALEEDRTVLVRDLVSPPPLTPLPTLVGAKQYPGDKTVAAPPAPNLSLELPDGSRQALDAVVVVGRAPSAPAGGPASRLVRLEGDGDVSRNHARLAVEGGTVVVTDLGSRNGTIVRIPGRPALKLRAGEPTPILVDTVIDFGGGIEVSVREG